jgi:hypothetical protein
MRRLLLSLCVAAALAAAAPAAHAAPAWYDGNVAKSYAINCPSQIFGNPYIEEVGWSWVGFYADINNLPDAGQVFYVHIVTGLVGNPCPGGMYSYPEISLPSGVQPAISQQTPVFCWRVNGNQETQIVQGCPQQAGNGSWGGSYAFGAVGQDGGLWPHGTGTIYELQIPVVSNRQLRGTLASPCDCVHGFSKTIDGNSSPVLQSNAGLVADPAPAGGGGGGGVTPGAGGGGGNNSGGNLPGGGTQGGSSGSGGGTTNPPPVDVPAPAFRSLGAPSTYSARRLLGRGLAVSVQLDSAVRRVDAVLTGPKGVVLAKAAKAGAGPGKATLKLRATKKGKRLLRRGRKMRARLKVTVTPTSGPKSTKSKNLSLKR